MSNNAKFFASKDFSAEEYRKHRPGYPKSLYSTLFAYHDSTGGKRDLCIDLGCGPGTATFFLSTAFTKTIGVDPSEPMIEIAKSSLSKNEATLSSKLSFEIGTADSLPFLPDHSVDLVTAATAAHWFPPSWWKEMERVVKPSGTVAVWVHGAGYVLPKNGSTPISLKPLISFGYRLPEIQRYGSAGNALALNEYDDFPLPDDVGSEGGKWKEVVRGKNGVNIPEEDWETRSVTDFKLAFATSSQVGLWRKDNPTLIGTPEDPVEILFAHVKKEMEVEDEKETRKGCRGWSMVTVKRSEVECRGESRTFKC